MSDQETPGLTPPSPRHEMERQERRTPDVIPLHSAVMREMAEPRDGFQPTPVWLVLLYFTLIGWGGWYLGTYSGSFQAGVLDLDPVTPGGAPAQTPPPDPKILGARVYNNCATCHQPDGQGVEGVYPPLAGASLALGRPEIPVHILLHGLEGRLTVRGRTYDGQMPAWNQLRDEHIAAVLTYVRSSWGNSAPPVDPALVAAIRRQTAARTAPWREAELAALAASLEKPR